MHKSQLYKLLPIHSWRVAEESRDYTDAEYSNERIISKLGLEEWILVHTLNSQGIIEGLEDNTTYSLTLLPNRAVCVKSYIMIRNKKSGELITEESHSQIGQWEIDRRLLAIDLQDETLEFIVITLENGIATFMDPDDLTLSVFMTEGALLAAAKNK